VTDPKLIAAGAVVLVGVGGETVARVARTRAQLEAVMAEHAVAHGADPVLVLCTVDTESDWRPDAVNDTEGDAVRGGAWGLSQLTLMTALDVDNRNGHPWRARYGDRPATSLLDVDVNGILSAHLMRECQNRAHAAGVPYLSEAMAANVASLWNSGRLLSQAPASTRDKHVPRFLRHWRSRTTGTT